LNVLFLYPVPTPGRKIYTGYSHGIGHLSAELKASGHRPALLIFSEMDDERLAGAIEAQRPGLIAVSCASPQAGLAGRLAAAARARTEALIVIGGPHATADPAGALSMDGVEGVCMGEGEKALAELAGSVEEGRDHLRTPNFWFRDGPDTVRNSVGPPVDLDSLRHPDRDVFPYTRILARHREVVGAEFMAARGCPFSCRYCANERLSAAYGGPARYFRCRIVEHLVDEIESVRSRYGDVRLIGFHDDIFGIEDRWLEEFAKIYPGRVGLPFWCNQRPDLLDAGRAGALRRAGCVRVHIGVESGSDRIRTGVLGRKISRERIIAAFRTVKAEGMSAVAFNMIGLPGETEADILDTIRFNREIRPDWIILSIYYPLPGTALGDQCREQGWVSGESSTSYYDPAGAIRHPAIEAARVRHYYRNFVRLVYGGGPD